MLCAAGDDVAGPDVSWSYHGFNLFRERLAHLEGFALTAGVAAPAGSRPPVPPRPLP